jgi:glycosyltransferase involved in cell wall biosynthesis
MITAITVVYNTPKLASLAINSVKKFYPEIPVTVVNGSTDGYDYSGRGIYVYNLKRNIGHGSGLHFALERCTKRYALIFDSDIEVLKPCIEEMQELIKGKYGVGHICQVNETGHNVESGIKYLHPYFALIDVTMYFSWHKAVHHGAPFIHAMKEIHNAGMSDKLLSDFNVSDYVYHEGRGTRQLNPKEFLKNWE